MGADQEHERASSEQVTNVIPLEGCYILLTFTNLELAIYDCRPLFDHEPVDKIIFNTAHADAGGVSWDNGLYVSADILYADSIVLVDFLDEMLGGETTAAKQKDPYFLHDNDEMSDNLFHAQMKLIGRLHYQAGQQDKEAQIAATMIMLMKYADLDSYSIIMQLQIVLGLSVEQAIEYYLDLQ